MITDSLRCDVETLHHAARLLENLHGASGGAVVVMDTRGTVRYWNAGAGRLVPLSAHQAVGQDVVECGLTAATRVVDGAELQLRRRRARRLVDQALLGTSRHQTIRIPAPSGNSCTVHLTIGPLRDPDGRIVGAAVTAHEVGRSVDQVTDGHRTRLELQRANERLQQLDERSLLIAEVTRVLSESLDLDRTLARFTELIVPTFADHCSIALVNAAGKLVRASINHTSPTGAPVDSGLDPGLDPRDSGLDPGDSGLDPGEEVTYPADHPIIRAWKSERITLVTADPEDFQALAPNTRAASYFRRVGMRSVLTSPLRARGRVIGVVSFGCSTSRRTYDTGDVTMANQLADRAAVAIDNARLYQHQQEVALTLQHSLLPDQLPTVPGLDVAARYLAATEGGQVGGDWYDLLPLPTGRVAVVIGDVMGRGVAAAALMGQVRAALRAYAGQDLPPAEVLTHADELVRGLADETIVTCVYGVYDPREQALVLCNAGHVPPLLLDIEGTDAADTVDATASPTRIDATASPTRIDASGPPLGAAWSEPYRHTTVHLPAGRMLALYTDGLVESHETDLDTGIDSLVQELHRAPRELEAACDAVVTRLAPRGTDDTALLLLRPERTTRPRVARRVVAPDPAQVRTCRGFVVSTLRGWGECEELVADAELVASELVTNAVRHARTPISLMLSAPDSGVVVEVCDEVGTTPRLRSTSAEDEGGRGLMVTSALASQWGTRPLPEGGKAVWCQLPRPGTRTASACC